MIRNKTVEIIKTKEKFIFVVNERQK